MDSISPCPLSRCTSMAAAMMISVSPVAFWNIGSICAEVEQEKTERTEKKTRRYLCDLVRTPVLLRFPQSGRGEGERFARDLVVPASCAAPCPIRLNSFDSGFVLDHDIGTI